MLTGENQTLNLASVKTIGTDAFRGCNAIKSIVIGKDATALSDNALNMINPSAILTDISILSESVTFGTNSLNSPKVRVISLPYSNDESNDDINAKSGNKGSNLTILRTSGDISVATKYSDSTPPLITISQVPIPGEGILKGISLKNNDGEEVRTEKIGRTAYTFQYDASPGTYKVYSLVTEPWDAYIISVTADVSNGALYNRWSSDSEDYREPISEGTSTIRFPVVNKLEIIAEPDEGYRTVWNGDGTTDANNNNIRTFDSEGSVNVSFAKEYTITLTADPEVGGSFEYTLNGTTEAYTEPIVVISADTLSMKALPVTGYIFIQWDDSDTSDVRGIDTGATAEYTASFTVLDGISVATQPTKTVYTVGEQLDLTGLVISATYNSESSKPVTGYTTSIADGATLNEAGTFTVTVSYSGCTATFEITVNAYVPPVDPEQDSDTITYGVSLVPGIGYTMSPTAGSSSPVRSGGSYSFTVSVEEGYDQSTLKVMVNGVPISADSGVYTITDITGARTVTAEVDTHTHEVTLPSGEGFTVTPDDGYSTDVPYGGTFVFTLTTDDPDADGEVRANGTLLESSPDGTYVITDITEPVEITFEEILGERPDGNNIWLIIAVIIIAALTVYYLNKRRKQ
jgi:hypothetical protein